mmetsp:Transcript_98295/g.194758  ORF Transcript_98295/g.194758 Transcript_98295/m.194758 type:complete len:144 (-) Transcript_98295:472-903(-)
MVAGTRGRRLGGRSPIGRDVVLLFAILAVFSACMGEPNAWLTSRTRTTSRAQSASWPTTHRGVALRAEEKSSEQKDKERLEFMESPLGQLIGFIAKGLSSGPLNEGKIWFAKLQAGEYDEAATSAKVESYISGNPVVMFSFSK